MRLCGLLFFVVAACMINTSSLHATETTGPAKSGSILKLAPIEEISDGYFGAKRLYFNLACNERFLQVLTERESSTALAVGILVEQLNFNCDRPDREVYGRINPDGKSLRPVTAFNEVWYCSAMCYSGGAPNVPPYQFVSAFGTSEKQATYNLPCSSAFLLNLRCDQEDVR